MINVDFTPTWYIESLAERKGARFRVIGFIAVAALVVAWSYDTASRTRAATDDLRQLQTSYDAQTHLIEQADAFQQEAAVHAEQARLLNELKGGVIAGDILTELTHLMPDDLTLRGISYMRAPRFVQSDGTETPTEPAGKTQEMSSLELKGWAASGMEIGRFVRRLSDSPLFEDVTLRFERPEVLGPLRVVEFLVVCRMPEFE
jgi:Tfp pilus assembly protein PilN